MSKQLILKDGTIVPGYDNETEFMNDLVTAHLRDRLLLLCELPKCRSDAQKLRKLDGNLKRKAINITHCAHKVNLNLDLKFERDVLINNDHLKAEMVELITLLQKRYQEDKIEFEKLAPILVEVNKIPSGMISEPMALETFRIIMYDENNRQNDMMEKARRFAEETKDFDWSKLEDLKEL